MALAGAPDNRKGGGVDSQRCENPLALARAKTGTAAVPSSTASARHAVAAPDRLFAGPRRPIRVAGIDRLGDRLARYVTDWPSRAATTAGTCDIALGGGDGAFRLDSRTPGAVPLEFADPGDAANAFAGALIGAYVAQDPDLVSLHAGCAVIGGRAVAVMGPSGAGKSSIALRLAAAGHRFVCDDRTVLRVPAGAGAPQAVSLGLAAKMRLPLPLDPEPDFAAYVARHALCVGADLAHLRFDPSERLPFGAATPLAAVAMLDRRPAGPARLAPAAPAALARAVLADAVAPHLSAPALMGLTARLAARVAAFTLTFADSAAAAAVLVDRILDKEAPG